MLDCTRQTFNTTHHGETTCTHSRIQIEKTKKRLKLAYINDLEFSGLFMLGLSWEHDVSVNLAVKLSVELEERRSFILQSTLSSFLTAVPSIMKDFQGPRFPKCYVKLS